MRGPSIAALVVVCSAQASAQDQKPPGEGWEKGTITVKGGKTYEGVWFRIIDNRDVEWRTTLGPVRRALGDVEILRDEGVPGAEPGAQAVEGGTVPVPPHVDLRGRCMLEPAPEWNVVACASPLVRLQLKHASKDAQVLLTLRSCEGKGEFSFDARNNDELNQIKQDLQDQYSKSSVGKAAPLSLWGSQVYRVDAKVIEFGDNQPEKSLVEHRFRRFGLEYAVSLVVGKADQAALLPLADQILGVFSFLPPVSEQEGSLVDFGRGFALARPAPDWQLQAQPFDEEVPARLVFDGGRGEVWISVVKGKRDARTAVDDLLKTQRDAKRLTETTKEPSAESRDGVETCAFGYEGYRPGKNVKLSFRGFAAAIGEQTLMVTGVGPLTYDDEKKINQDVDRALAGVRLLDPKSLASDVLRAKNALSLVSQGYAAHQKKLFPEAIGELDKAIELVPSYAHAYYLRALARKGAADFEGFRADLEKAAQLDPSAAYDKELGPSYAAEGEDWLKKKEYARAADAFFKAYRAKDEKAIGRWVGALRSLYGEVYVKSKQVDKGLQELQKRTKDLLATRPDVLNFWGQTLREGIDALVREKEYGDAKRWVRVLKNLRGDPKAKEHAEAKLKVITDAEKR